MAYVCKGKKGRPSPSQTIRKLDEEISDEKQQQQKEKKKKRNENETRK